MNNEGGKGNNRYALRNRKRNDRAGEEEAEEEEDNEGEEGRDWQRHVLMRHTMRILLKRIQTMTGWKCQEI
jgi:hypothetical protein